MHHRARMIDAHETLDDGERGMLAPGTLVGGYRVERALAEGGMAVVYEAVHQVLPRRVAIKVMHRCLLGKWAARERLFQEARILECFDHPGLVRVHDAGVLEDDRPWIAMELVEGLTLAQRLALHGRLEPLEVISILDATAAALEAAHRAGVVHRDLKPENIILHRAADGVGVKVIDWGIARCVQPPPSGARLTRANMTPGTPLYMSPEQARGKVVDGRSDVYALGVIACEALCGEPPFRGDSPLDVVIQHLTVLPSPLRRRRPELPAALDELVLAMLAKEPQDRPAIPAIRECLAGVAATLRDGDEAYEAVEIVIDGESKIGRPRWTPRCRAIVPTSESSAVSGEIVGRPRSRARAGRQAGKATGEVLGLIVTTLLTALMLAAALALPALDLGRSEPQPLAQEPLPSEPVLVNIGR